MSNLPRIQFQCSQCNKHLVAPHRHAGKRTTCPSCQHVITIPSAGRSAITALPHVDGNDCVTAESQQSSTRDQSQGVFELENNGDNDLLRDVSPALRHEIGRLLLNGDRLRAIKECCAQLDCDFDVAHHIVRLIEKSSEATNKINAVRQSECSPEHTQQMDLNPASLQSNANIRRVSGWSEAGGAGAIGGALAGLIASYGDGKLGVGAFLVYLFVTAGLTGATRRILASVVFSAVAALVITLLKV